MVRIPRSLEHAVCARAPRVPPRARRPPPAARRRLQHPGLQEFLPIRLIQFLCCQIVLTRKSAAANFPKTFQYKLKKVSRRPFAPVYSYSRWVEGRGSRLTLGLGPCGIHSRTARSEWTAKRASRGGKLLWLDTMTAVVLRTLLHDLGTYSVTRPASFLSVRFLLTLAKPPTLRALIREGCESAPLPDDEAWASEPTIRGWSCIERPYRSPYRLAD